MFWVKASIVMQHNYPVINEKAGRLFILTFWIRLYFQLPQRLFEPCVWITITSAAWKQNKVSVIKRIFLDFVWLVRQKLNILFKNINTEQLTDYGFIQMDRYQSLWGVVNVKRHLQLFKDYWLLTFRSHKRATFADVVRWYFLQEIH